MNLIVFIDKEQNILDLNILKDYKECQTYLNNLVQNNSLIFDDKSQELENLFLCCKKIYFDKSKIDLYIPEFLRPIKNKKNYVISYADMFNEIKGLDEERVFIFGNKFIFSALPYCEKIYLIRFNLTCNNKRKKKYFDLLMDSQFELLSGGVPYFTEDEKLNFSIYKNKCVNKFKTEKKEISL